jgi:hypothetical protein
MADFFPTYAAPKTAWDTGTVLQTRRQMQEISRTWVVSAHNRRNEPNMSRSGLVSAHNRRNERRTSRSRLVSAHKHQEGGLNAPEGRLRAQASRRRLECPDLGHLRAQAARRPSLALYGRAFHRSSAGSPLSSPSTDTVPVSSRNCAPSRRSNPSHRVVSARKAWPWPKQIA